MKTKSIQRGIATYEFAWSGNDVAGCGRNRNLQAMEVEGSLTWAEHNPSTQEPEQTTTVISIENGLCANQQPTSDAENSARRARRTTIPPVKTTAFYEIRASLTKSTIYVVSKPIFLPLEEFSMFQNLSSCVDSVASSPSFSTRSTPNKALTQL